MEERRFDEQEIGDNDERQELVMVDEAVLAEVASGLLQQLEAARAAAKPLIDLAARLQRERGPALSPNAAHPVSIRELLALEAAFTPTPREQLIKKES